MNASTRVGNLAGTPPEAREYEGRMKIVYPMWILTGNEYRCDTLRWGFEFRVEQHLLERDLRRVLHSCLHSIGVWIIIYRATHWLSMG